MADGIGWGAMPATGQVTPTPYSPTAPLVGRRAVPNRHARAAGANRHTAEPPSGDVVPLTPPLHCSR